MKYIIVKRDEKERPKLSRGALYMLLAMIAQAKRNLHDDKRLHIKNPRAPWTPFFDEHFYYNKIVIPCLEELDKLRLIQYRKGKGYMITQTTWWWQSNSEREAAREDVLAFTTAEILRFLD